MNDPPSSSVADAVDQICPAGGTTNRCLCIPVVGKDKTELTSAEQTGRRKYAGEVMGVLRGAVRPGYNNLKQLQADRP